MWYYEVTQSQHYNNDTNYNDVNVMHAIVWFKIFGGYFHVNTHDVWRGKHVTRSQI